MAKERPLPQSLHLPLVGVDSHAHITSKALLPDFEGVISRARSAGVANIVQVFLGADHYYRHVERFASHPYISFTLGIHPSDAHLAPEGAMDEIEAILAKEPRVRGLGETGLDFYWKECPPQVQYAYFSKHIELAKKYNLPLVIHSRDAFEETLKVLDDSGFAGRPLMWHCFGGTGQQADMLIQRGWHVSIPGPVSYPANQALRDALPHIPLDKLLLETDCPYLSPQSWRGQNNEPALCVFTAQAMAEALNMPLGDLWQLCGDNARKFFGME